MALGQGFLGGQPTRRRDLKSLIPASARQVVSALQPGQPNNAPPPGGGVPACPAWMLQLRVREIVIVFQCLFKRKLLLRSVSLVSHC